MKIKKSIFAKTICSSVVVLILLSSMVISAVATGQDLINEAFDNDNNNSYCTMTYDGTGNDFVTFTPRMAQYVAGYYGYNGPHEFKQAYVGGDGALFDMGYNKTTQEVVLIRHGNYSIVHTELTGWG